MTKYYLDTEFLEGTQKKKFFGKTPPTIDLISIGVVAEDGREYYAISKDFNLEEAWKRYDHAPQTMFEKQNGFYGKKIYWIRDNVLFPIFEELHIRECEESDSLGYTNIFNYSSFKRLIKKYGKSRIQIASEICDFIYGGSDDISGLSPLQLARTYEISDKSKEPDFYTYYGAYDWVVFCWLFGKMIGLPKGFPMYSKDLKQMLDEKGKNLLPHTAYQNQGQVVGYLKEQPNYPKQENCHNALDDARWNKKLYEFLQTV